jgi:transcriptional regulator with XRE-family HTH domain
MVDAVVEAHRAGGRAEREPAGIFARELIRYRSRHGLSAAALAEQLGVGEEELRRLELGEREPEIETLLEFSARLGSESLAELGDDIAIIELVERRAGPPPARWLSLEQVMVELGFDPAELRLEEGENG